MQVLAARRFKEYGFSQQEEQPPEPEGIKTMATATSTRRPVLTQRIISVREMISCLLDLDADTQLSLSREDGNPLTYTQDRHYLYAEGIESTFWSAEHVEPVSFYAREVYDKGPTPLWGYITVRELINRLIELNPSDDLVMAGTFESGLKLRYGKASYRRHHGHEVFIYSLRPIWES